MEKSLGSTWYKVEGLRWGTGVISEVNVQKSTSASIWINGNRQAIATGYTTYHPTMQQAIAEVRSALGIRKEQLTRQLAAINARLEELA